MQEVRYYCRPRDCSVTGGRLATSSLFGHRMIFGLLRGQVKQLDDVCFACFCCYCCSRDRYCSCVSIHDGNFPTELPLVEGSVGLHFSQVGGEYGTTTGRSRRCGWLDIPQTKYSALINGFTSLNLTKVDVLTGIPELKIGKSY